MVTADFVHEWLWKPLKKPYSIATTNKELQEQGTIWFVVKKSREWYMSEYLTQGIKLGDVLHLQWPVGHLVDSGNLSHYLLLSVGSWLSPMIWLYNTLAEKQDTKIAMLYGERYLNQVLPSTRELFEKKNENTFHRLCLSKEDLSTTNDEWRMTSGYVQKQLDDAIEFLDTKDISVFICGKPEMVDDVKSQLLAKWIDIQNIKFEKY